MKDWKTTLTPIATLIVAGLAKYGFNVPEELVLGILALGAMIFGYFARDKIGKACIILALLFGMFISVPAYAASNVTFAWDASEGATGYKVYQSQTSGIYNKETGKVCDTATLTCTVNNLADGTYYWVATAYDAEGNESDYSNEVTATLDTTSPPAPGSFKITVTVNVSVNP